MGLKSAYLPRRVSPPGATLLDMLNEKGMSRAHLAVATATSIETINEIVKGKAAITPGTANELERILGVPAAFWNKREAQYRRSLSRKKHASLEPSSGD